MGHSWSGDARGSVTLRATALVAAVAFVVTTLGAST